MPPYQPILQDVAALSERARIHINHMLDRHFRPDQCVRSVTLATQEKISVEAVERYAQRYAATVQARNNARERTNFLVCEIIHQGDEVTDTLRAAFHEAFQVSKNTGAFSSTDPLLYEAAERHRQELALKKIQVSIAERRVNVQEKDRKSVV